MSNLQNVAINKQELIMLSRKITLIDWERKTRQNKTCVWQKIGCSPKKYISGIQNKFA